MNIKKIKVSVIMFPGSNGHNDLVQAFESVGFDTKIVFSNDVKTKLGNVVGLPGGFSFGDYYKSGTISKSQPIMNILEEEFDKRDIYIIGICNGFQILCERKMLHGGLINNKTNKFIHSWEKIRVCKKYTSPWTYNLEENDILYLPIAHGEGNYQYLDSSESNIKPVFYYTENKNGSKKDISGVIDKTGKILGMMPHPERCINRYLGSVDGLRIFNSLKDYLLKQ